MKENLRLRSFVSSGQMDWFLGKNPQSSGFTLVEYRVPCISRTFYLRGSLCKDPILYYSYRFILKMSVLNFWHNTKTALPYFAYRYNCLTLARLDFWKIRPLLYGYVASTCKLVSFVFHSNTQYLPLSINSIIHRTNLTEDFDNRVSNITAN